MDTADGRYYANTTTLNNITAPNNDLSMNSHIIYNLADPIDPQDAVTKNYLSTNYFD